MKYMNAEQAAEYLSVHRSRIYKLAKDGRLGSMIAGFRVFTKDELDRYRATERNRGGRPMGKGRKKAPTPEQAARSVDTLS